MEYLQYLSKRCLKIVNSEGVLNLIINGIPSILKSKEEVEKEGLTYVLNLIINGIPSIPKKAHIHSEKCRRSFKPYYKWNTFNTIGEVNETYILKGSFKPYYKWNTFNTIEIKYKTWSSTNEF